MNTSNIWWFNVSLLLFVSHLDTYTAIVLYPISLSSPFEAQLEDPGKGLRDPMGTGQTVKAFFGQEMSYSSIPESSKRVLYIYIYKYIYHNYMIQLTTITLRLHNINLEVISQLPTTYDEPRRRPGKMVPMGPCDFVVAFSEASTGAKPKLVGGFNPSEKYDSHLG
jgi:hypothetical protein